MDLRMVSRIEGKEVRTLDVPVRTIQAESVAGLWAELEKERGIESGLFESECKTARTSAHFEGSATPPVP